MFLFSAKNSAGDSAIGGFIIGGETINKKRDLQDDVKKKREKMWNEKGRKCTLFEKGSVLGFILSSIGRGRGIFLRFAPIGFLVRFVRARVASIRLHLLCSNREFEQSKSEDERGGFGCWRTGVYELWALLRRSLAQRGQGRGREKMGGAVFLLSSRTPPLNSNSLLRSEIIRGPGPDRVGPWLRTLNSHPAVISCSVVI